MNCDPPATNPSPPHLDLVIADYLDRLDRGERVRPEEFLAAHADLAAELRAFIAASTLLNEWMTGLRE